MVIVAFGPGGRRTRRRPVVASLVLLCLVGTAVATPAADVAAGVAAGGASAADLRPGRYIVQIRDDVADPAAFAASIEGAAVVEVFDSVFAGFVADLDAAALAELSADPAVVSMEPDRTVELEPVPEPLVSATATQSGAPWGLDRIDQRTLPLTGAYNYTRTGSGVTAYIIDTGIRPDHADFGGRVASGFTAINDGWGTGDCQGHGTHVAGTVGGSVSGVAKSVTLRPVRVLDCEGSGSLSGVLSGINWVISHHTAGAPAVANMSLGGTANTMLDAAVTALINDGVAVVAAAGNETTSACNVSPARVQAAITVAASDGTDSITGFSNYGPCVDLIAPGDGIRSAGHASRTSYTFKSGTSMAAPHVAGAAALLLQATPSLTPLQVASRLDSAATLGATGGASSTPDLLLYVGSETNPTPSNDAFAAATVLPPSSTTVSGSSVGATKEPGEPDHAGEQGGRSVWWRFTAPSSGTLVLSTAGSSFDTLLAVYTGGIVSALTEVGSNDDTGGRTSRVSFLATPGTTYWIAVDGFAASGGSISLGVTWSASSSNDAFASATVLPSSTSWVAGSNEDATKEPGEPDHAGEQGGRSVWWRFTAPADGIVEVSTEGSSFDTLLAVYTGTTVSTLSEVAADGTIGSTSWVEFAADAGTTYWVAVDGFDGDSGSISLAVTVPEPPPANDAFASATALAATSTTVSGSNRGASKETGEPRHAGFWGGSSVWWTFTPPTAGTLIVSTAGSSFDTVLAVYTGTVVSDLEEWASNDDFSGATSQVRLAVEAGVQYRIAVDGIGGSSGSIALGVTWVPAPANDAFEAAASLNASATVSASSIGASKEPGEPNHAGMSGGSSVWWTFTAPANGMLAVSTAGSSFDTLLGAYTGSSVSNLVQVAASDDVVDSTSQVSFPVSAGTTYSIAVDGYARSSGTITLSTAWTAAPANDDFVSAAGLPSASSIARGTNVAASRESGEPVHADFVGGGSVWWRFTAPFNGAVTISTAGSSFDTLLGVYTGPSVSNLVEVAANDDTNGVSSRVTFRAVAGQEYSVAVDGVDGETGSITLSVDIAPQVPAAPAAVAVAAGVSSVNLSWSVPADGGSAITDYVIQRSSNGRTWVPVNDGVGTTASYTVRALSNGTRYQFRVAARNRVGQGAWSPLVESVPRTVPSAPRLLAAVGRDGQVVLNWSTPSTGGAPISDYVIQISTDGRSWSNVSDGQSLATTTTVPGLVNGVSYRFRVAAVNVAGSGSFSSSRSATPRLTVPGTPRSLRAIAGSGLVALSWSPPSSDGGSAVLDYVIQVSTDGRTWSIVSDAGVSSATAFTVRGLVNGVSYRFRVAAVNIAGSGPYTFSASARPR